MQYLKMYEAHSSGIFVTVFEEIVSEQKVNASSDTASSIF